MAFREVRVYEVKEVLRLWLRDKGTRPIAALVGLDRKTVQRYIAAATGARLQRDSGEDALDDEPMAKVCEHARPHRPDGYGESWAALRAYHDQLKTWLVEAELTSVRATDSFAAKGWWCPSAPHSAMRSRCSVLAAPPARATAAAVSHQSQEGRRSALPRRPQSWRQGLVLGRSSRLTW
jgi:hypothetical protein